MIEEAGGRVTDFAGNYYSAYQPHILATNGLIHEELRAVVNGAEVLI
jgi:myo-inositol-1(or 4)-monophosphatase